MHETDNTLFTDGSGKDNFPRYWARSPFGSARFTLGSHIVKHRYDDIVDKTDYIPDSELIRAQKAGSAQSMRGIYDFNNEKEYKEKHVSGLEVLLRSPSQNRFDKADIPTILDQIVTEARSDSEKAAAEQLKQSVEQLNNLRQARIDELLGVKDSSSE